MNNDTKATLTGVVGGILTLVVQFGGLNLATGTQEVIVATIVSITLVVLGILTNKKDVVK